MQVLRVCVLELALVSIERLNEKTMLNYQKVSLLFFKWREVVNK